MTCYKFECSHKLKCSLQSFLFYYYCTSWATDKMTTISVKLTTSTILSEIDDTLCICSDSNNMYIFLSQIELIGYVLNGTTSEIFYRKWGPKSKVSTFFALRFCLETPQSWPLYSLVSRKHFISQNKLCYSLQKLERHIFLYIRNTQLAGALG